MKVSTHFYFIASPTFCFCADYAYRSLSHRGGGGGEGKGGMEEVNGFGAEYESSYHIC